MPLRRYVPYGDPLRAGRHPYQTYILVLCLVSGIPLLAGKPPSGSLQELLPEWLGLAWGISLAGGASLGLVGSYWRGHVSTALTIERVGLLFVGSAAVVYGTIIVAGIGLSGALAGAVTFGFGAASLRRARDLGRLLRHAAEWVGGLL